MTLLQQFDAMPYWIWLAFVSLLAAMLCRASKKS